MEELSIKQAQPSKLQMSYLPGQGSQIERPQTAQVLSKIHGQSQYRNMGPKNPSTAASSNQQDMYSSRGFGELGSTKKASVQKVDFSEHQDDLSSDEDVNECD